MPSLSDILQQAFQRVLDIPSSGKSLDQMKAELRRVGFDLEKDLPMMAAMGLLGSAQDMAAQVRQLYQLASQAELPVPAVPPPVRAPGPSAEVLQACQVLRVSLDATLQQAEAAYRQRVKRDHPDRGGDAQAFEQDHQAIKTLRDHWRGRS
ncbi:MAG: hypothetical protein U1B30_15770 [Pseudomonadota bacterium]|nr:hypothetical protein [Pseudomonadota bacterium]